MPDPYEEINPFQPPPHLFKKYRAIIVEPVEHPSIRVDAPEGWRLVKLYEFHPSYDDRLKFRSYAYIEPQPDLIDDPRFHMGKDYMQVDETAIMEEDVRAIFRYCVNYNNSLPLIIREIETS